MKRIIFTLVILILLWLAACSPSPSGQDTVVNPEPEDTGGAAVVDDTAAPPDLPLIPAFNSGFLGPDEEEPFAGVNFELKTTLPAGPQTIVVEQHNFPAMTEADARRIADQLGFTGPLYVQGVAYVDDAVPPTYVAFDGSRRLTMQGSGVTYEDWAIALGYHDRLPFERSAPLAETFLRERDVLDFDYEIGQIPGGDVGFYPLRNGIRLEQPEIAVTIDANGAIAFFTYPASREVELLGDYPLRSAEAAWQLIQAGVVRNGIPYSLLPGDEEMSPADGVATPDFWRAPYEVGQEVHRYGFATVYLPLDQSSTLRIQVENDLSLAADEGTLQAIAEHPTDLLHVWGVVGAEEGIKVLDVAGWEVVPAAEVVSWQGQIKRDGEQTLLVTGDGQIFILPNVPTDVTDGQAVTVTTWTQREAGVAYPVLDWGSISAIDTESPGPETEPPPFAHEGQLPAVGTAVIIGEVKLLYFPMILFPAEPTSASPYVNRIVLLPVWKFFGQTDNDQRVEFLVPAVAPEYLQMSPRP